jgi:hypothetical protein
VSPQEQGQQPEQEHSGSTTKALPAVANQPQEPEPTASASDARTIANLRRQVERWRKRALAAEDRFERCATDEWFIEVEEGAACVAFYRDVNVTNGQHSIAECFDDAYAEVWQNGVMRPEFAQRMREHEARVAARMPTRDATERDAARYRAIHPYLRGCMAYDARGHVLRLGERTIPTGVTESGWTGELIDKAVDYAVAIRSGTLPPLTGGAA